MQSLRNVVIVACGQDVRRCRNCSFCGDLNLPDMDISLETMIVMVQLNDDEILTSRTLWSDHVLTAAKNACYGGINIPAVIEALRVEAIQRGITRV